MSRHQPFQVIGYHSCDKEIGLEILNGKSQLVNSNNDWDWLGDGIYFWEQNPHRALEYAIEVQTGHQFNKGKIKTAFVLGAIIQLGNCLNLIETESLKILAAAYDGLEKTNKQAGSKMPVNNKADRKLDCAVLRYVHQSRIATNETPYDSIRSAFDEVIVVFPGASFSSRNHIQICVRNPDLIKGYFLPRPIKEFNPNILLS